MITEIFYYTLFVIVLTVTAGFIEEREDIEIKIS